MVGERDEFRWTFVRSLANYVASVVEDRELRKLLLRMQVEIDYSSLNILKEET